MPPTGRSYDDAEATTYDATRGGEARAVRAGEAYVDVGTLNGYRAALELLDASGPGQRAATIPGERR